MQEIFSMTEISKTFVNSTYPIGGVSCTADSLMVAESFVLSINISGKKPAHRKSANRQCDNIKKIQSLHGINRNEY